MTYRDKLVADCTALAKQLGRKLSSLEMVNIACAVHEEFKKVAVKERKRSQIIPEAEQIYAVYPKKVGSEDALRAISNALKKHDLAYLLSKTTQFAEAVNSWPTAYRYFQDGGDRCPHPASWFNAGRYADDPKEWKRMGAKKPAEHQHVSLPEPANWRESFPEFVDRDKPWHRLDAAQQTFIINTMPVMAHFSEPVEAVEDSMKLRNA